MDYYPDSNQKRGRKKREWVKNAIIIFLVILLILTFFSNTIMNYSLPEVAAQYPEAMAITSKIRGTGTVEAAQTYNVTIQEARTVASVGVKAGDEVKEGQTLVTLDETESAELSEARISYESLKLEYEKMLLDSGDQNAASSQSLQSMREAVGEASADLSKAQTYENGLTGYKNAVTAAQNTVNQKKSAVNDIQTQIDLLEHQKDTLALNNSEYQEMVKKVTEAAKAEEPVKKKYNEAVAALEKLEDQVPTGATPTQEQQSAINDAEAKVDALELELAPLTAAREAAEKARDEKLDSLTLELDKAIAAQQQSMIYANAEVTDAEEALTKAQNNLQKYQDDNPDVMSVSSAKDLLKSAQDALEAAEAAAADAAEQADYEDQVAQKDLEAKAAELKRAEEKIQELEEKSSAVKLVSRYNGVVKEINVAAGDTTTPDEPLMVVELTEKGYTMSATVTKDQARTLKEGAEAEITNLWSSNISLVLTNIESDKNDPANSRVLTFSVKGDDVAVGQSLSFSVGNKNANYDVVVPSSAIHTDADGSFVYTVEVKSSPLGNRYTIKKKTVTVLASDETNSAISGEVTVSDFVVTTSTVPIDAGSQVRIAE